MLNVRYNLLCFIGFDQQLELLFLVGNGDDNMRFIHVIFAENEFYRSERER